MIDFDFDFDDGEIGDAMQVDYAQLVANDMVEHLCSDTLKWPDHFTSESKLTFIDDLLEYFTLYEAYEQCTRLEKLKDEIIN